jgi:hypothetical protein
MNEEIDDILLVSQGIIIKIMEPLLNILNYFILFELFLKLVWKYVDIC